MSNNRFQWTGLNELREALRNLPADLTGDASLVVEIAAEGAADTVRVVYEAHRRTGKLAEGVVVEPKATGPFAATKVVRSKAKHAWLFDNGSQARHWASGKSTGVMWGKTPPTHVFVQTMIRARRKMYEDLKDLLVQNGLSVSGDA